MVLTFCPRCAEPITQATKRLNLSFLRKQESTEKTRCRIMSGMTCIDIFTCRSNKMQRGALNVSASEFTGYKEGDRTVIIAGKHAEKMCLSNDYR